jgi:hypothetical protein
MSAASSGMPTSSATTIPDSTENIFWTPIAGMPAPILPRANYAQMSPMGLGNLLHAGDMDDRLGRDGFKINEDWQQSAMDSYHGGGPNGYLDRSSASYPPTDGGVYQPTNHGAHPGHPAAADEFDPGWWGNGGDPSNPMCR